MRFDENRHSTNFEKLISNKKYNYIGNGNPNARILIIGKEPAIDRVDNPEMYRRDITDNREYWYDKIISKKELPTGTDPAFP